jgi:diguanylate cyclase (GGDEF)-like protein
LTALRAGVSVGCAPCFKLTHNQMNPSIAPVTSQDADYGAAAIQSNLRKLERRDLWASGNTAIIILGLTALVVSLSISLYLKTPNAVFGWHLGLAVWALVALVVFFTGHTIFQQRRLRTVQRELSEQQIQAEVFRRLALFDPLTGLYNRRFAEERLRAEIARAERRGLSMVVVLLDLNDFKKINDRYGHPTGDQVLKEFAKSLSSSTRGSDLAVRWGGDEFMLLLLDCEIDQLSVVLGRLVGFAVEADGKPLEVSFAVGWKAYEPGDEFEGLIEAADRNLYVHKAAAKVSKERLTAPVSS